jgi:hypothetical protein
LNCVVGCPYFAPGDTNVFAGPLDCGLVAINLVPVADNVVPMHPLVAINLGLKRALIAIPNDSYCGPLQIVGRGDLEGEDAVNMCAIAIKVLSDEPHFKSFLMRFTEKMNQNS